MNIKINKHRKLPKYYCHINNSYRFVHISPEYVYNLNTLAEMEKLKSSAYIFDSIRPPNCIGEVNNFIIMEAMELEHSTDSGCFPVNTVWRYKFIKPIDMYSSTFEYLYLI